MYLLLSEVLHKQTKKYAKNTISCLSIYVEEKQIQNFYNLNFDSIN